MAKRYAMHSGQLIDIEDLKPEHIHLEDIAHHLAKIQRYAGATPIDVTYSVGEHSINLYKYISKKHILNTNIMKVALLHDAAEAYIVDLPSPLKQCLSEYKEIERNVEEIIWKRFQIELKPAIIETISKIDKRILIDEVKAIMSDKLDIYEKETGLQELGCDIQFNQHPSTIKQCFLTICKQIGIK